MSLELVRTVEWKMLGEGRGSMWQQRALSISYCRVQGNDGNDLNEMYAARWREVERLGICFQGKSLLIKDGGIKDECLGEW